MAQLQWIFKTPDQQVQVQNPFAQEINQIQQQRKREYEARRAEQLAQQQGVLIKPQDSSFGQQKSPFGGISTFQRTPVQTQQVSYGQMMQTMSARQKREFINKHDKLPPRHQQAPVNQPQQNYIEAQEQNKLQAMMDALSQQRDQFKRAEVTKNPYTFYHQYIKPILAPFTYQSYRKYNHANIKNVRIVHINSANLVQAKKNVEDQIAQFNKLLGGSMS